MGDGVDADLVTDGQVGESVRESGEEGAPDAMGLFTPGQTGQISGVSVIRSTIRFTSSRNSAPNPGT